MKLLYFLNSGIKLFRHNGSSGDLANKIKFMIFCLVFMIAVTANAQSIITISQAIGSGLTNKKNIIAGKTDITTSQLQTQALYRKYWPQVSFDYTYFYNPILQTSILPIGIFNPAFPADATQSVQFGTQWTQSAGLTLIQPLIDLSIQRHIKEAKLQEQIVAIAHEQTELELAYTIAQTYIDIYLQQSKIASSIADTNRTYISYILLKNKFDEKRLLKSDLNKSEINHNNAVQTLSNGIAQLIEDKVFMLFLMGESDMKLWDFQIDTSFLDNYSFHIPLNESNLDRLPDVNQLTMQSQLAGLQAKSERTKYLPVLNFKGFLGANQFTDDFNPAAENSWFGLSYVGLEVKFPLLFGESPQNKIQQLLLQSNQFNLKKEDKILEYKKDVIIAKHKIANLMSEIKTRKDNISLGSETIRIFQARVEEGQESATNLNLEEADLQILKADYETAKKQLWVYWLDYLKASGQLSSIWL